ncbi:aldo/keto reductase [Xenorhabdus stockiae]|uniref:aldo/keto reductase n=1 Tax=Xenorhabdus stockiae TaxID=351614 RepID=UPI003CF0622C
MKYRYLGSTGLSVSELCFGAMTFGEKGAFLGAPDRNWSEFGVVSENTAYDLVYKALDAGINFFDTADCYKNGQGEELLGKALKGKRHQVIIGTKGRWQIDPNPNSLGASRYHIINAVELSLKHLKTDYIDIYHLHGFDPRTSLEDTLRTLDNLIRDGKVRYIGVSNYAAWQLMKALGISERLGFEKFCVYQGYYNIAARELEHEIIPLSVDQNVGITVWSPLAGGFLTGKYPRNQAYPEGSRLSNITPFESAPIANREQAYQTLDVMREIAQQHDASIAQVALNWLRTRPGITSLVIGATKMTQLEDNIAALSWKLSLEEIGLLNKVSEKEKPYPYWHICNVASDRRIKGDIYP